MHEEHQHTVLFSMEEVLQAAQDKSIRLDLARRIEQSNPREDALKGVKGFLEEHDYDFDQLSDFLSATKADIKKSSATSGHGKTFTKKHLAASIAGLLIIVGAALSFFIFEDTPNEKLYAEFHESALGLPVTMGAQSSMRDSKRFNESMNFYKDQQYRRALDGFQSVYQQEKSNDTLNYYIGVTHLELNDPKAAIVFLSKDFEATHYQQKASYYLALAHLKTGKSERCRSLLETIVKDPEHPYSKRAQQLLSALSKL